MEDEEIEFDFQEFTLEDLDVLDGCGGWATGSLEEVSLTLDPTWLDQCVCSQEDKRNETPPPFDTS